MTVSAGFTNLLAIALLSGACRAAPNPPASTADRSARGVSSLAVAGPSSPTTDKLDMDVIFPPGDGRDLVLDNCLTCHSFLRFVLLQRTPEQWAYTRRTMRQQVPHLDEAQVDRLFGYLEAHFNDRKPPPELPEWFLRSFVW